VQPETAAPAAAAPDPPIAFGGGTAAAAEQEQVVLFTTPPSDSVPIEPQPQPPSALAPAAAPPQLSIEQRQQQLVDSARSEWQRANTALRDAAAELPAEYSRLRTEPTASARPFGAHFEALLHCLLRVELLGYGPLNYSPVSAAQALRRELSPLQQDPLISAGRNTYEFTLFAPEPFALVRCCAALSAIVDVLDSTCCVCDVLQHSLALHASRQPPALSLTAPLPSVSSLFPILVPPSTPTQPTPATPQPDETALRSLYVRWLQAAQRHYCGEQDSQVLHRSLLTLFVAPHSPARIEVRCLLLQVSFKLHVLTGPQCVVRLVLTATNHSPASAPIPALWGHSGRLPTTLATRFGHWHCRACIWP
jgi:hypothetical protein